MCLNDMVFHRLRAVPYFSLQSYLYCVCMYCARNPSTRGAKARDTINEGVWFPIPYCNITWFTIALAEIRTRRILREKAGCKKSRFFLVFLTMIILSCANFFWVKCVRFSDEIFTSWPGFPETYVPPTSERCRKWCPQSEQAYKVV